MEPLLFLLYVNDLHNSSGLDRIKLADDTNLFYEHKDLKTFLSLVNQELQKVNEWFEANKLSLNVGKTKYSLFNKPSRKDDLPLLLPRLLIKKHKVERVKSIKFLGIFLDENLSWKDHVKYIEKKVAKNIGLLYRAVLGQLAPRKIAPNFKSKPKPNPNLNSNRGDNFPRGQLSGYHIWPDYFLIKTRYLHYTMSSVIAS